jgi:phosphopantothenate---cysteine ligase (CTP)
VRCLVTAGATLESLDHVRRLTNFSTGRLGSGLATDLVTRGHVVTLLRSESATAPLPPSAVHVVSFRSTIDLASRFLEFATDQPIAIFHAAAVSDFAVGLVYEREEGNRLRAVCSSKFSTRGGNLLVELRPTPKLLPGLREWFPGAMIYGWKFEVEGDRDAAIDAGLRQIREGRIDGCVVNGPAHGDGFTVLDAEGQRSLAEAPESLFGILASRLEQG